MIRNRREAPLFADVFSAMVYGNPVPKEVRTRLKTDLMSAPTLPTTVDALTVLTTHKKHQILRTPRRRPGPYEVVDISRELNGQTTAAYTVFDKRPKISDSVLQVLDRRGRGKHVARRISSTRLRYTPGAPEVFITSPKDDIEAIGDMADAIGELLKPNKRPKREKYSKPSPPDKDK